MKNKFGIQVSNLGFELQALLNWYRELRKELIKIQNERVKEGLKNV